jgi:hypothetical protein
MDWIDLNPKYKNAGKSATSFTFKAGKRKKRISNKELRNKVQSRFPVRVKSGVWMSERTKGGKPRWPVTRESVVNKRAQHKQGTSEWIDLPKKDLVEMPSQGEPNAAWKKPIGAQMRVYKDVGRRGTFWIGKYTGKKILHSSQLDVDHMVSKFRAQASLFMGNKQFATREQKYAFIRDTDNLFISTRKENQDVKKGYGLRKYVPPLKEARPVFAQTTHDVFEKYGMKMSIEEAAKYSEYTGNKPTVGLWNQEESDKINKFMDVERAKTEKLLKMRTR